MVDSPRGPRVEPVAVIGIGCRLPGDAHSPDAFWDLLSAGRNTTRPLPAERWRRYENRSPEHANEDQESGHQHNGDRRRSENEQ